VTSSPTFFLHFFFSTVNQYILIDSHAMPRNPPALAIIALFSPRDHQQTEQADVCLVRDGNPPRLTAAVTQQQNNLGHAMRDDAGTRKTAVTQERASRLLYVDAA
jgi:hypothetical protein